MTLMSNSPVLIPLLFLSSAMLMPVVAWKRNHLAWRFAMLVVSIAVGISIYNVIRIIEIGHPIHYRLGNWAPPIGIEYVLDHLSAFVILVINVVAWLVLLHSQKIIRHEIPGKEMPYYGAAILMLLGFNGIVITGDLFNLYVFLEICSLALYGLVAVGHKKAQVAAFRYLIMGTIAASFYLLGVGFLYMKTGSLNMADTKDIVTQMLSEGNDPTIFIALCLMVLGLGIKMALFPMHNWLPDAYTYAPSSSSALVAPTGTKVGAYVLLRVMFFVFGVKYVSQVLPLANIIAWLAAIGIIYGSIMAIAQKELKRMLAYSSVAQIGYIGLGIGMANPIALVGAVLHILNHAFMKACLFLVAGNLRFKLGHSNIYQLTHAVRKKMPWTMLAFTIAALSMVGLPPMAGFFSKWYLVLGTVESSNWIFLAVILLSSLLNAVYFFRVLEKIYMKPISSDENNHHDYHDTHPHPAEKPDEAAIQQEEVGPSMLIPTLIMAGAIIAIGLLNAIIVKGILAYIIPAGM